jgi:hypothetical protein
MDRSNIFRRKSRKSQAALEFLITYGWAILSVLIVVSALAYFGVFNTSRYINDACEFGDQMNCEDFILHKDANIGFKLRNNFGVGIDIMNVTIKSDYGTVFCPIDSGHVNPNPVMPGALFEVTCNITSRTLSSNDKIKVRSIIQFRKSGVGNPLHNQTGTIYVGVSP